MIRQVIAGAACVAIWAVGAAAAAQDEYSRYGFDRPGYNVYVEDPGPTAGVFMRYRPGEKDHHATYGAALTFDQGRIDAPRRALELRFNGPQPDEVWLAGERELRVMGVNDDDSAGAFSMVGVGALLVSVLAVAANDSEDPCASSGGFLSADGCTFPAN